MKILLIGATGGTGQELLKQGLASGHEITALVRDATTFDTQQPRLRMLKGSVLNQEDVDAAMAGQEAVVSSLGTGVTFKHVTLFSDGTRILLQAMGKHNVRRIVCITGVGAGDSHGHGGFLYDHLIEPALLSRIYADKNRQEELLRQSDRDWVIVRPAALTNDSAEAKYKVLLNMEGVTATKISRADVAAFVLAQLNSNEYLHKTPLITN